MTKLRSKIVSRQSLNAIARQIGLDRYVILDGEQQYAGAEAHLRRCVRSDDGCDLPRSGIQFRQPAAHQPPLPRTPVARRTDRVGERFQEPADRVVPENHHTIRFRTTRQENSAANHPLFRSTALIDNMEVGHGSGESKKGGGAAGSLLRFAELLRRNLRRTARQSRPAPAGRGKPLMRTSPQLTSPMKQLLDKLTSRGSASLDDTELLTSVVGRRRRASGGSPTGRTVVGILRRSSGPARPRSAAAASHGRRHGSAPRHALQPPRNWVGASCKRKRPKQRRSSRATT